MKTRWTYLTMITDNWVAIDNVSYARIGDSLEEQSRLIVKKYFENLEKPSDTVRKHHESVLLDTLKEASEVKTPEKLRENHLRAILALIRP